MVVFPNCKINLGLNITAKRADGFHNLETVFYPVAIHDVLEILPQPQTTNPGVQFSSTGLPIEGDTSGNLCVKAYHLLKKEFPLLPAVNMHLHKAIPMGAGLGGGSADGAFTLQLLNKKFQLNIASEQLMAYAMQLGSDCPFFIINQPCFAESRGEKLQAINLDLSAYQFVIINPGIHINTAWAFSQMQVVKKSLSVKQIIQQPIHTWKTQLQNDFELPVFASYPEIKAIKENLYMHGAVYASMTGSGSTVFGIFEKGTDLSHFRNTAHSVFII